ncbi:hypothetical protein N8J89_20825 [Crossiella sp. CA-258035]|uniref:hypothetical protein n=1 Tax=Crossiella sp. CA-258035 TaxID=2981138 RepID=UPI0024BC8531|nr:hypothetical protein [Crossiella sp. CA-258035]WHT15593.1 hypothetical protein N8J89_20825 [Crossiella sp. CA-258035]
MIGVMVVAALVALPGVPADTATVTGTARIRMSDPVSEFELDLRATTFRLAHHYQGQSGWLTATVDCVRVGGPVGVVTGVVDRVHGIGHIAPGDRFSLSVLDRGRRDLVGMAWQAEAARCLGPAPSTVITSGDLRVRGED